MAEKMEGVETTAPETSQGLTSQQLTDGMNAIKEANRL